MKKIELRACNDIRMNLSRALTNVRSAETRLNNAKPKSTDPSPDLTIKSADTGETEWATISGLLRSSIQLINDSHMIVSDLCQEEDR